MIKIYRYIFIAFVIFRNPACAQSIVENFSEDELFKGASISAVFFDVTTGETIDEFNSDLMLCPASTWKLLTVSAAAERLEHSVPFTTQVSYTGRINNGILRGDLIIKGNGDPTLGSNVFNDDFNRVFESILKKLTEIGVSKIEGKIIVIDTWLVGLNLARTRIWEDMGNYYGGSISGLNFADNSYNLHFDTRYDLGEKAKLIKVDPEVPGLTIESEVLVSKIRSDQAYIFGSPLESKKLIYGTLPAGYDEFIIKGSLPNPPDFFGFQLYNYLLNNGISVNDYEVSREHLGIETTKLIELSSPPLKDIIKEVVHNSNNLYAEVLMAKLGGSNKNGSIAHGVAELENFFTNNCDHSQSIQAFDGSGLSRFNAISANQMKALILYCHNSTQSNDLVLEQLPYFGKEGTVKRLGLGTELENNVRAKSGSMTGVIAYSGIMNGITGREIGFSIMINNYNTNSRLIRKRIETLLLEIYQEF